MYEFTEYAILILLVGFGAVNTIIQVKGNKISIKRKKTASAILAIGGFLCFIWSLVQIIQIIQEKIIKVDMLQYLFVFLSAIWFITGVYLLVYCKKLEK